MKRVKGFTITEIMISSLLLSVVILIAWTGLLSALNMSNKAQAITARKVEMNRALDVLGNEIRQAHAINRSGDLTPDGSEITLKDVVNQGGVPDAKLGPYGEIALYMELPFTQTAPSICPAGTDNAGKPPQGPSDYDPVIYDVRDAPLGWIAPKAVSRYGRIPEANGTLSPCSNPVANDIMADSLASQNPEASCPNGYLAGQGGFQTCTHGEAVDLLFKSTIDDVKTTDANTTIAKRSLDFQAASTQEPAQCSMPPDLVASSSKSFLLRFNNGRSQAVNLYHLDGEGERQFFQSIPPNQSLMVIAFINVPWVITDVTTQECLQMVVPDTKRKVIDIN